MKDGHFMFGICLGVAVFMGCGLVWVISADIDCLQVHNQNLCKSFQSFGNNMPIGIVGGFMIMGLTVGLKVIDDKDNKPKTNTRSPIT